MLRKTIVLGCLSGLIIILTAALWLDWWPSPNSTSTIYSQESSREYKDEKNKIEEIINIQGVETAYRSFKEDYISSINKPIFHNVAHFLGAKLYESGGVKNLMTCDETAGYGCFHGFIGSLLSDKGKSFLGSVETFCQDKTDSLGSIECIHGIGHGLLAATDYSLQNLISTLKDCDLVSNKDFLINICYSGVFMEYNIRTMQAVNDKGFAVRDFNAADPYDPCPNLGGNYKLRCYYELPYWWIPITNSDFALMDKWCLAINDKENQESCFRGIGHVIPWAVGYDETKIIKECGKMTSPSSKLFCIEDVVKRLVYRNGEKSLSLCNYLEPPLNTSCLKISQEFMCTNMLICHVNQ